MDVLQALFKRSRMLSLEDIEKSEAGLARHIIAIANHPKVPCSLYNSIGDFVTDGTMIKDAAGETLLDRWAYMPETVTAIVKWANESDYKSAKVKE